MPQNGLKCGRNGSKIHFLRDILEAKLGDNGNQPSGQQNIISIDVIIGVEMHIDQYLTSYKHQKRTEMAKIPENPNFGPFS